LLKIGFVPTSDRADDIASDGAVVYEGKSASTAEAIADKLSEAPSRPTPSAR
jgi:hypothetical protein